MALAILQAVAEQLAEQFEVGGFAAAGAGAGEFEEGFQELDAADVGEVHRGRGR